MQIDDFLTLIHERRSIRRFKPGVIPREDIEKILEAGRWAMSGANGQPWEFVVLDDTSVMQRIYDSWLEPRVETYEIEQSRVPDLQQHNHRSYPSAPPFMNSAAMIVVLGDRRTYQATVLAAHYLNGEGGTDSTYYKGVGNATHNLILAAAAMGLGTQWISVSYIWGQAIKKILGIPEIMDVHTIVCLGYPDYQAAPAYRRELSEITHYNGYDMSKYRSGSDIFNYLQKLRGNTAAHYNK